MDHKNIFNRFSQKNTSAQQAKQRIHELQKSEHEITVDSLIAALNDPDENVRSQAAYHLGLRGELIAVEPLIAALTDPSIMVCQSVIYALGLMGDKRALEPLKSFLNKPELQKLAHDALEKIGYQPNSPNETLGEMMDEREIKSLIAALQDVDVEERARLVKALSKQGHWLALAAFGRPAMEPLLEALNDGDEKVRSDVAHTLGVIGDPLAVDSLIAALNDPSLAVCQNAIIALGEIGDTRAIAPLKGLLNDPSVGKLAQDVLRKLGHQAPARYANGASRSPAVDTSKDRELKNLINALQDDESPVERARAAKALGKQGDWRAVEPLIAALYDDDTPTSIYTEDDLEQFSEPAVQALIRSLEDADANVRISAVMALAKIGDGRAAAPLVQALQDNDQLVLMEVFAALIDIGKPAVTHLMKALSATNPDVQRNAALALGELGDPSAVDPLVDALMNPHYPARGAVTRALGQIGDRRAVDSLIWALRDEDLLVRRRAAIALGQIGDVRSVEPLVQALEDNDHLVSHSAVVALNAVVKVQAERAVDRLIADLRHPKSKVRASAVVTLGRLGDQRAMQPLVAALSDPDPNLQPLVVEALRKIRQVSEG